MTKLTLLPKVYFAIVVPPALAAGRFPQDVVFAFDPHQRGDARQATLRTAPRVSSLDVIERNRGAQVEI